MVRRLAVALFVLSFLASSAHAACEGKQRWKVKTTADADSGEIKARKIDTTIAQLSRLPRPAGLKKTSPRTDGVEKSVYVIEATLVTFFSEPDQDRHLVLCSRGKCMVAEIADPRCVASSARFHDQIHDVRAKFDDEFRRPNGQPARSKKTVNRRVRVTGVGFFDSPHKVGSAAPNFIELHPVIDIKFLN